MRQVREVVKQDPETFAIGEGETIKMIDEVITSMQRVEEAVEQGPELCAAGHGGHHFLAAGEARE